MKLINIFAGYYVNRENKIEVSKIYGVWEVRQGDKHVAWFDSFKDAKKSLVA